MIRLKNAQFSHFVVLSKGSMMQIQENFEALTLKTTLRKSTWIEYFVL